MVQHPTRRHIKGLLNLNVGRILFVGGPTVVFVLAAYATELVPLVDRSMTWIYVVGLIALFLVPMWVGAAFIVRGSMLWSPDAREELAADPRPPVVFLRSFSEDGASRAEHDLRVDEDFGRVGNVAIHQILGRRVTAAREIVKIYFALTDLTLEQELNRYFGRFGPVVAIGRPGEQLQTAGAARMYVSDDEWQSRVIELLSSAQLVIWQAGMSAGTWWELRQIVARVDPRQVVLIVPSPVTRGDFYRDLFDAAAQILPKGLPDSFEDLNFILFDEQWNPSPHKYVNRDALRTFFASSPLDLEETFSVLTSPVSSEGNTTKSPAAHLGSARFFSRLDFALAITWIALIPILGVSVAASIQGGRERGRTATAYKTLSAESDSETFASTAASSRAVLEEAAGHWYASEATRNAFRQFQTETHNWAQLALPRWRQQVAGGDISLQAVTKAVAATGNESLARTWAAEAETLRGALHYRLIRLQLDVRIVGAKKFNVLKPTIEREMAKALREGLARASSSIASIERPVFSTAEADGAQFPWALTAIVDVQPARYDENDLGILQLPQVARTRLVLKRGDAEVWQTELALITLDTPSTLKDHEFLQRQHALSAQLAEQTADSISVQQVAQMVARLKGPQ